MYVCVRVRARAAGSACAAGLAVTGLGVVPPAPRLAAGLARLQALSGQGGPAGLQGRVAGTDAKDQGRRRGRQASLPSLLEYSRRCAKSPIPAPSPVSIHLAFSLIL